MRSSFLQLLQARADQLCYFYVYGYRHPITKVWRYIGKGHDSTPWGGSDRKNYHLEYARCLDLDARNYHNPRLIRWIRQLHREGLEPEIILLKATMSEDAAYLLEEEFINLIGRADLSIGTLYNLDSGGRGSRKRSEVTLRKLSVAMKGKKHSEESRCKMSKSHLGKPGGMLGRFQTEEAKRKMSLKHLGKKHTEETLKKMCNRRDSEETRQKKREAWVRRKTQMGEGRR